MTSLPPDSRGNRCRLRVGYALLPKKQDSFIQDSLLTLARSRGVDLVKVSPSDPLPSQGPFDCLLHKLYGDDWKSQLQDFVRDNPNSLVIDPPEAIERLHNRISMLQVVSEIGIEDGNNSFGIPEQIVIYDKEALFRESTLRNLEFPLIAKPLVADGSAKSHKMVLVFNAVGLNKLKPPIVLQQFINHGGVIFKVYVVGEHVKCVKRKSLPDVTEENLGGSREQDCLSFSQVSNLRREDDCSNVDGKLSGLEETEMPPHSFLVEIAKGYAKMPSYEKVLTDFFVDIAHKMGKHLEGDAGLEKEHIE
ncbi:hypothetical protein MLD38_010624 [Melastoma candidum]|uniref:Uncharacterized protein n=1 Tax=Melastoma candidum TaxID=119954 RepID=A0ACB9R022_9MYRT|nr:hypothetical protein MLD38_010624 [Melastoma candidum]